MAVVAAQGQQLLPAGRVPHLRRLVQTRRRSRLPSGSSVGDQRGLPSASSLKQPL
jgi:hypothetical protein